MRNAFFRITWDQWHNNPTLRNKVISDARGHAGRNPGMIVYIKREVYGSKPKRWEVIRDYCNRSGVPREWK